MLTPAQAAAADYIAQHDGDVHAAIRSAKAHIERVDVVTQIETERLWRALMREIQVRRDDPR